MDAGQIDVLLIGPRVAHLSPYFERRGFAVVACADGAEGVEALEDETRHLVCLELNLGTYAAADFVSLARGIQPDARYLLLDDPTKAGLILKALRAGADAYVATPPDESALFLEVERLLEGRTGAAPSFSGDAEDTIRKLKQRNADLEQRLRDQPAPASPANSGVEEELRAEVQSLQKQLDNARADLAYVEDAATDAGDDKSSILTEQLSRIEREKTDLEAEVVALRGELGRRDESAGEGDDERNQLFRDREEANRRAEALQETVNALEAELAQVRNELAAARDDRNAFEKERDRLQEQLEQRDALASQEQEQSLEAAKQKDELASRIAALEDELKAAQKNVEDEHKKLESEQKKVEQAKQTAVQLREKMTEAEKGRLDAERRAKAAEQAAAEAEKKAEAEAERVRGELAGDIQKAKRAAAKAEERAIDLELGHDDMLAEIERHKDLVKQAQEQMRQAERNFRKEKLRLVEAQEQAGSADAYQKMEAMLDELKELRALRDKLK